jgi:hypothetical protein
MIDLSDTVIRNAAHIIRALPQSSIVRTLDAIHLACAQQAFSDAAVSGQETASFVSSDNRLLAAAQWLGLPTDNPNNHA